MAEIPSFEDFKKTQGGAIPSFDEFKAQQASTIPGPPAGNMPRVPGLETDSERLSKAGPLNIKDPGAGLFGQGYRAVKEGLTRMVAPGNSADERMGGAATAGQGGLKIAAPFAMGAAAPALVEAPAATLGATVLGTAGGYGGGKLLRMGAKAIGGGPGAQDAAETAGNVAGGLAGGLAGGNLLPKAINAVPNLERAGNNFNAVADKIGPNSPVDVGRAYPPMIRAGELAKAGATPPKIITDFTKRVTDAGQEPVTYQESRDFASNAGNLAASDRMSTNRMMSAQVKALAKALDQGNEATADKAGVGDQYRAAMKEYGRAAKLRDLKENVKDAAKSTLGKAAIGALGGGALGYGASRLLK